MKFWSRNYSGYLIIMQKQNVKETQPSDEFRSFLGLLLIRGVLKGKNEPIYRACYGIKPTVVQSSMKLCHEIDSNSSYGTFRRSDNKEFSSKKWQVCASADFVGSCYENFCEVYLSKWLNDSRRATFLNEEPLLFHSIDEAEARQVSIEVLVYLRHFLKRRNTCSPLQWTWWSPTSRSWPWWACRADSGWDVQKRWRHRHHEQLFTSQCQNFSRAWHWP